MMVAWTKEVTVEVVMIGQVLDVFCRESQGRCRWARFADGGCARKDGVRMTPRDLTRVTRTVELP